MRGVSFLIIALLAASLVSAATPTPKAIYDKWHFDGDTFETDGQIFTISHFDFNSPSVYVMAHNVSLVINEGECRTTITRQYCIESIFRDLNYTKTDKLKFAGGDAYAGIHIQIYKNGPEIKVERKYGSTSPNVEEKLLATITISNTGTHGTDTLRYEEHLPPNFVVSDYPSFVTYSKGVLSFSGNIPSEQIRSFQYTYYVKNYTPYTSIGSVTYSYAKSFSSFNVSASFVPKKPYSLTATFSPASIEVNQKSTLSIALENRADKKMTITDFHFEIPEALRFYQDPYTSQSKIQKSGSRYSYTGFLDVSQKLTVVGSVQPEQKNVYSVPIRLVFTDAKGIDFEEDINLKLTASYKDLLPILSIKESVLADSKSFRVAFSVKNPNVQVAFYNIRGTLDVESYPTATYALDLLEPGRTTTIYVKDEIQTPKVATKKELEVIAKGTYSTSFGDLQSFEKAGKVSVTPRNQSISISHSLSASKAKLGDNITVVVKVKSTTAEQLEVDVQEEYTEGLVLNAGKTSETMYFSKAEEQEAYIYNLVIPMSYDSPTLTVTSRANVPDIWESEVSTNTTIEVNLSRPELPKPTEINDTNAEPDAPKAEEADDLSWWDKMVNGVVGFFKRLFG